MNFEFIWANGVCFAAMHDGSAAGWPLWIAGFVLAALISYVLGSLNFGILISKYKYHQDIRQYGSGNAGMTNMLRTYGKGAALITLLGDALKAAISVLVVGHLLVGYRGAYVAGLACIVGHVFPVFYRFKGGKGVVTTAVMILCLNPVAFAILLLCFIIIVAFTKYISMGSIICMLMYPLIEYKTVGAGPNILISVAVAVFVIWMHRSNIQRLRQGTENKFSLKSKKKDSAPASKPDEPHGQA